jgi:hypothetical protein
LSGVRFPGAFQDDVSGVRVSTSKDFPSVGVSSGSIGGRVTDVAFVIADADRVPYASNKQVTISFNIVTAIDDLFGSVEIYYGDNFLKPASTVTVTPSPPFKSQATSNSHFTQLEIASGQAVPAGRVTVTLSGVQFGGPTLGYRSVSVRAKNNFQSNAVDSGRLGGQVTDVSWAMAHENRYSNRRIHAAAVTVGFTLATAYTSPGPNQITINFPPFFFQSRANINGAPTVNCSNASGGLQFAGISSTFDDRFQVTTEPWQLVLSSQENSMAWDTAPKICVFGNLETGPATIGGQVSVQSTQDLASSLVVSGPILQ